MEQDALRLPSGRKQPLLKTALDLVLDVLVTQLQLHNVLKRTEQRLIKVEVWKLRPARQHLRQDVVDEGDGLLGDVALLVTRRLQHTGGTELNSR